MNINASTLPDDSNKLKEMLLDFQEHYDRQTGILLEQISLLRAQLYAPKTEKHIPGDGPQPMSLFDMPEPEPDEEAQEEVIHVPAHDRKKRGRKPLDENLPRVEEVHDLSPEEKICGCGAELSQIGEEVSEQLDIIPAKVQVIRHIRPQYACKHCEGLQDDGPTVKIAPVHPQIIPKSIASPGLLAHVLTGKFVDHMPFYRQEKQLLRLGGDITRASMCNWAQKVADACLPLLNLLQDEITSGNYINIDETPVQVLAEPGRAPTTKSYMWVFRRGDPEKPVLVFEYHATRHGDAAKNSSVISRDMYRPMGLVGTIFLISKKI